MHANENPMELANKIRSALVAGETHESIVRRFDTSIRAVEVVAKGMKGAFIRNSFRMPTTSQQMSKATDQLQCPWRGCFVSIDGTNVAGWSRPHGAPRLAQTLAICRWLSNSGVRFSCWFDSNFKWCLKKYSTKDAETLNMILRNEPTIFKQPPAGRNSRGETIKADTYVLIDANSFDNGLILTGDLYRKEAKDAPAVFGWTQRHPERRITGQIAANGDVLLGDYGEVRIPVIDDSTFYIH